MGQKSRQLIGERGNVGVRSSSRADASEEWNLLAQTAGKSTLQMTLQKTETGRDDSGAR